MSDNYEENCKEADRYIQTLQSMCIDFQIRRAITIGTFVANLRLFANAIEKNCIPTDPSAK